MRAFAAITTTTVRQLLGGRRLVLLLLMALLPTGVLVVLLTGPGSRVGNQQAFHDGPLAILMLVVLPVASLVFGAGALGDERRDATLSFILLRPLPRTVVAAAKLLGAWLAAFSVVGGGAAAMSLAFGALTGLWAPLGPLLLAAALSTLTYTGVFLALGYLTARAVLIGLAYVFIWESGMTAAIPSLATVSLMRIGLSAYTALIPTSKIYIGDVLGAVTPGVGGAVAKASAVALLALAVVATLLRRRDIA